MDKRSLYQCALGRGPGCAGDGCWAEIRRSELRQDRPIQGSRFGRTRFQGSEPDERRRRKRKRRTAAKPAKKAEWTQEQNQPKTPKKKRNQRRRQAQKAARRMRG